MLDVTDPWTLEQALLTARTAQLTAEEELARAQDACAAAAVPDEADEDEPAAADS